MSLKSSSDLITTESVRPATSYTNGVKLGAHELATVITRSQRH